MEVEAYYTNKKQRIIHLFAIDRIAIPPQVNMISYLLIEIVKIDSLQCKYWYMFVVGVISFSHLVSYSFPSLPLTFISLQFPAIILFDIHVRNALEHIHQQLSHRFEMHGKLVFNASPFYRSELSVLLLNTYAYQ